MDKKNSLNSCKFYQGESQSPYQLDDVRNSFWEAERMYQECLTDEDLDVAGYINRTITSPAVKTICNAEDGVAPMMTAFLFSYYENFAGDYHTIDEIIIGFRDWYGVYKSTTRH